MNHIKNLTWKGSRNKPLVIDAKWVNGEGKLPVILWAHGYKGFKDWGAWPLLGDDLAEKGALFISFNFSFNGGTPEDPIDFPDLEAFGENNYSTEVADFKRMLDFIHSSNTLPRDRIDLEDLTIIGHSRGGGMAVLTAAQDTRVNKLITLASISDLERRQPKGEALELWKKTGVRYVTNGRTKQEMPHYYQMHLDYEVHKDQLDIGRAALKISIPALIIHGILDMAVPFTEAEELHSAIKNSELFAVKTANHVFGASHPWDLDEMPNGLKMLSRRLAEFLGLA